jgi:hypothetical protein
MFISRRPFYRRVDFPTTLYRAAGRESIPATRKKEVVRRRLVAA